MAAGRRLLNFNSGDFFLICVYLFVILVLLLDVKQLGAICTASHPALASNALPIHHVFHAPKGFPYLESARIPPSMMSEECSEEPGAQMRNQSCPGGALLFTC